MVRREYGNVRGRFAAGIAPRRIKAQQDGGQGVATARFGDDALFDALIKGACLCADFEDMLFVGNDMDVLRRKAGQYAAQGFLQEGVVTVQCQQLFGEKGTRERP